LLDLTMPDLDGFAVIAELKKDPALQSIPIILLTATLTPERLIPFPANRLVVDRQGEMRLMETLNLVKATLGVLETDYGESTDEVMGKMV
jgi:CheY-like chemotaxis protein